MWGTLQSYINPDERIENHTEIYSRKVFVGGLPIDM